MSIRKHAEWDGWKLVGYADIGSGVDCDSVPVANDVLVMMLVALNSNWNITIGHLLLMV